MDRRVKERIDGLPKAFLRCRHRRHRLDDGTYFQFNDGVEHYIVGVFVCDSCALQRYDFHTLRGEFVFRRYRHPKGYIFSYTEQERAAGVKVRHEDIVETVIKQSNYKSLISGSFDDLVAAATRKRGSK